MAVPSLSRRKPRKLLVTGCARSGTLFLSRALRELGLRVGHEYVDDDGTVSHFFASGAIRYPVLKSQAPVGRLIHQNERPEHFAFERTVHLVRHPVKVCDSLQWTGVASDALRAAGVPVPKREERLRRAVLYWYGWNRLVEQLNPERRVTIEAIDNDPRIICELAGVPEPYAGWAPKAPTDTHHARRWLNPWQMFARSDESRELVPVGSADRKRIVEKARALTWDDVVRADNMYGPKVRELAERYGYQ